MMSVKLNGIFCISCMLAVFLVFWAYNLTISISQSNWRWQELIIFGFVIPGLMVTLYQTVTSRNKEEMEAKNRLVSYITRRFIESGVAVNDISVVNISSGVWEGVFDRNGTRTVLLLYHGEIYQPTKWIGDDW